MELTGALILVVKRATFLTADTQELREDMEKASHQTVRTLRFLTQDIVEQKGKSAYVRTGFVPNSARNQFL